MDSEITFGDITMVVNGGYGATIQSLMDSILIIYKLTGEKLNTSFTKNKKYCHFNFSFFSSKGIWLCSIFFGGRVEEKGEEEKKYILWASSCEFDNNLKVQLESTHKLQKNENSHYIIHDLSLITTVLVKIKEVVSSY